MDNYEESNLAYLVETAEDAAAFIAWNIEDVISYDAQRTQLAQIVREKGYTDIFVISDSNSTGAAKIMVDAAKAAGASYIEVYELDNMPISQAGNHFFSWLGVCQNGREEWIAWYVKKLALETKSDGELINLFCNFYDTLTPIERERVRTAVDGNKYYKDLGITSQALSELDELQRTREYQKGVTDLSAELERAIRQGAQKDKIKAIANELLKLQETGGEDWGRQTAQTFEDELNEIGAQPQTLKTKWKLGTIQKKTGQYKTLANIEFWPADIAVFAAPTSHGKTMVLCQAAIDAVKNSNKTFIYISCEESKRQLVERMLNVYTQIPTTDDGVYFDESGEPRACFMTMARKKAIKAAIRNNFESREGQTPEGYTSAKFCALERAIKANVEEYGRNIRPRLILIHSDNNADSICANVKKLVEMLQDAGREIGGVFVDYIQLLTSSRSSYSRHDELKDVCAALKSCAEKMELPIIIAAQLNREIYRDGIDGVTVANLGEGSDIEKIAHDIYLVWQTNKTPLFPYKGNKDGGIDANKFGIRSRRIFAADEDEQPQLLEGYLYLEQLKARDGITEIWGLLPFDGESGQISETDEFRPRVTYAAKTK